MVTSVKGERVKVWRKDIEGRKGTFYRYSVGVSKKQDDGSYVNAYIPVVFSKKSGAPEKIENGAVCDFTGFMSVESYTDKEGKERNTPMIVIMSVKFEGEEGTDADSFEQMEEDIPF